MIPANSAPHDLEARDVLRSLSFAQRRARDTSKQLGASCRHQKCLSSHGSAGNPCKVGSFIRNWAGPLREIVHLN
jgi:hypothetical protein